MTVVSMSIKEVVRLRNLIDLLDGRVLPSGSVPGRVARHRDGIDASHRLSGSRDLHQLNFYGWEKVQVVFS